MPSMAQNDSRQCDQQYGIQNTVAIKQCLLHISEMLTRLPPLQ